MDNRRSFISAVAAFFGFGAATNASIKTDNVWSDLVPSKKKGFIVFTIDIGNLAAYKAEAYIENIKKKFIGEDIRKVYDDWEFIFLPVRQQDTTVQIFPLNGSNCSEIEAQELIRDKTPFIAPNKEAVMDYVLLYLGAPVVSIELDKKQLEAAYDDTKEVFEQVALSKGTLALNVEGIGGEIFKQMAYARAMIMLGNIRGKYTKVPGPDGEIELEGEALRNEGHVLLHNSMERLNSL